MEPELCLQGLFFHLVERGFPLSVRDYMDMVKALRAGYGVHDRDSLLWLCQTLWGYTEEEDRYLAFLFDQWPFPTAKEIAQAMGEQAPAAPADQPAHAADPNTSGHGGTTDRAPTTRLHPGDEALPELAVSFVSPTETGRGLPQARVAPQAEESFILSPKPLVPLRILIITLRRFRRAMRAGPSVELDIEATVAEKCRIGLLHAPVLVPARRNQAHLTVLVDVSRSMLPWRRFNGLLRTALHESRLGRWAVFYFDNVPENVLYQDESLEKPRLIDHLLKEESDHPLLIVSDGGAARGFRSRRRVRETEAFLKAVSRVWHPVAWMNPMPRPRWQGTSAQAIGRHVPMFALNEDGLVHAIDVLRGTKLRTG